MVFSLVGFGFYTIYTLYIQSPIMDEFRQADALFEEGQYANASIIVESILERKPYQRATLQLKQKLFVEKKVEDAFSEGDAFVADARVCIAEGNYSCATDFYSKAYTAYSRLPYGNTSEHRGESSRRIKKLVQDYNLAEGKISRGLLDTARAKASRDRMEAYYFLAGSLVESREIVNYRSELAFDVAFTRMTQLKERQQRGIQDNEFLIREINLWLERVDSTSPKYSEAQRLLHNNK